MEAFMRRIAGIFFAGMLGVLPVVVTVAVIGWLASFAYTYFGPGSAIGRILVSLGLQVHENAIAPYVMGLLLVIVAIFLIGLVLEHRIGTWLIGVFDATLARVPVVSSIYDLSKRFTSIMDRRGGGELKGMSPVWCFFGGDEGAAVLALLSSPTPITLGKQQYLGVLIPTAPVPFGGALIYVPAAWIKPAEGGVEHLMNVYVSMGVTPPKNA
jgi:uncharacterized membrane protein